MEIRYHIYLDVDGNEIERIPYEVSDEQLLLESLEKEANARHTEIMDWLNRWGQLNDNQKDDLLKFLAGFYLVAGQRLGYFVL